MSGFQFADVSMLHALWLVPVLGILMAVAARGRSRALATFVESGLLARLGASSRPDPARRVLKAALALAAIGSLATALARPAWDTVREDVSQRGRDVVFLLDVSRSMLAEDLSPNRLERAKLAILDTVERFEGDRVALAVFAGATVVKCPLTLDYGFFRMALSDSSPFSVSRGGTLIGDALRKVMSDVFDGKRSNYRDIVLITDGEDHESFPVEAAAEAGRLGVRLIAIGLGDERVGRRIPVGDGIPGATDGSASSRSFLRFEGQEVWSRLDADALRRMAEVTPGGIYLNVATGTVDLGEVYRRLVASADSREIGTKTIERPEERFQLFLALCILLLALEIALTDRRRAHVGRAAALALASVLVPQLPADSVRGLVNDGNESVRAEEFDEAIRSYDQALEEDPSSPYASLNRATAHYRSGNFDKAAEGYSEAVRQSLGRNASQLQATGLQGLGNALYRQAEQAAETSPQQAIDFLVPAARSYLDALRADPRRSDAANNLELARRLIRELRERASQRAQSGEEGQGRQEPGDRSPQEAMQQAAREQQQLADESEKLSRDRNENRDADAREQQEQRASDLANRQEALNRRTEGLSRDSDPSSREHLEEAARNQEQAKRDLDRNRPGQAERSQRDAAEALERAAGTADGSAAEEEGAQSQQDPAAAANEGGSVAQDPMQTAEEILAKEQSDRRRRQIQGRVGAVAVERDW